MTITFTGKYSRSNSALRNETSSGVNSADLACVRLRSGGPTRKGHQSRQPRSRPLTGALACVLHRYSSVFGFIRLFDSFRRCSFRDRKLDWLLCDHPFLRGSKFPHRGILILDARSRQSSIAPTSPHPPNLMCLKVQRKLRKFQSERYSTRRRRFFIIFASLLLPTFGAVAPRESHSRLFPGVTSGPSSVILLHGSVFYPFNWRSHGVASETPRMPAKARVLAAAQNRSPIYVRYMTTPGEHIGSVRLFPYRASPAISTRNPYPVS